jgi:beta-galactosidase
MNTPSTALQPTRDFLSLDGEWALVLDPEDQGVQASWFQEPPESERISVQVPSVWDRWVPDYDGVGWYFKNFDAPENVDGRHVELHFAAADYYVEVWLNGIRLGDHEGGYTPFSFPIAAHVREDGNQLAVRLIDPHGPDGFGDFKPKEIPCAKETGYFDFAGIWGSVWLETKPKAHIEDVFVMPDLRRSRIAVRVETSVPGVVHLDIEGTSCRMEGEAGELTLPFPDFEPWTLESPTLYTLNARLIQEDGAYDVTTVRFGMREFTVKDNRFYLNNHPVFLKAVLHQPDFPATLTGPESEAMARKEIELAKEAGFNMLRLHIKPAPKITLDLADEMGILLYEEPAIGWLKKSAYMEERCETEVREMVLRDRNHPSLVLWGMLNESGNADYVTDGGAQLIKGDLALLTRSLDPSRLIIDDCGGVNATREPARMLRPYRESFEDFDDLHIYQRAPVDLDIQNYYRHNGDPDKLYFLSEFGFGGAEDLDDVIAQYAEEKETLKDARFLASMVEKAKEGFDARNLSRVFGDFSGMLAASRELQCDAIRLQIDAIRSNPKLAGYCFTQLFDAGHEFCAGVADRWRRPKPALKAIKAVQAPLRPLILPAKTNLRPREEVNITVLFANEERLEGRADLSLQVVGPTNQVLWKKKRNVKLPRHGKEIWSGVISASGAPGVHKFVVRVMQNFQKVAESSVELAVFDTPETAEAEVNWLDPQKTWAGAAGKLAKRGNITAPVHVIPPLAKTIRAYPDNELMQVLAQVKDGAVAIFFEPPEDWNELGERLAEDISATPKDGVGCFLPVMHYAKLHPVFEKLPARGLMRQAYCNVVPAKTFLEESTEDICGSFDTMPIASGNYMMDKSAWWGSDILVRRYGSGQLVFTHLRVLENLGEDPLADRLFVNLVNHFSRRSVSGGQPLPPDVKAVEWMRREQTNHVRRWMVLGEFPNWSGDKGHETAYPPEQAIDFSATYPGWYKPITWKAWHTLERDKHRLDLQAALTPIFQYYPRFDHGVAYAYAEFSCDRRQDVLAELGLQNATKIWLNGKIIHESTRQVPHDQFDLETVPGYVKQGKNTVLVKCSKIPGPFRFSIDFRSVGKDTLQIKWWR